ncbi:MAG: DUF563 domain-containing protein, partial [Selenomonadaceae bacterium]|nr:DUF563 domain-containing protein [Selenomonadaceae bacterium]
MVNTDYLYNPDGLKDVLNKNYFLDIKLGFQVIENGMILPHKDMRVPGKWNFGLVGIVDSKGEFIRSTSVHYGTGGAYNPPPESIQHRAETAVFLFMLYPTWGHCITDNIRRLWFLKSEIFKSEFKNCPLVYISWGKQNLEALQDFKRLLEILEVDVDRLQEITQPTRFEKIILPDESFNSPHNKIVGFTNEYCEAIEHIRAFALKNRTPTSNQKLYFFHGSKGQYGEERLAEYFKSKGYEIINPAKQKLTFDEELNLLINCKSFVATNGSSSHNSLFLRDDTQTIIIPRIALLNNPYYQEIVNQVHPLNVTYIDSTLSIFSKGIATGLWFFMISEQLKRFFGDKWDGYEEEDFKTFLQYVKNLLGAGLEINPNTKNCYATILPDFMAQLKQREDLISAYNMPSHWEKFQPSFSYQTHVHNKGWGDGWKNENEVSNPLDQMLDVLAIKINFPNHKVYYSVYFNEKEGWSKEVSNPEMAGTVGIRKPIYGMKIRLDEAGAKEFDILYRMHKFDGKWTAWAKNGEALYSHGVKLNAIQVKLQRLLLYQTHVHIKGSWTDGWKNEKEVSNPLDQMLDVLAIRVNHPEHKVYYSVYYDEKEGWTEEVSYPTWAGV